MAPQGPYNPDARSLSCDLLVVGGGIVGLWVARLAGQAGLSVVLLEAAKIGSGASGGLLGALMPHMPERWNPKKQFQFDALVSLETKIAEIEAETGLACGYRRCGRLLPLAKPHHADLAIDWAADAQTRWQTPTGGYSWQLLDRAPAQDWPAVRSMPHGLVLETLAARVNPRRYLTALAAGLGGDVTTIEGDALHGVVPATGVATTTAGRSIKAGSVVLTAGHAGFALLERLTGRPSTDFGIGVKGQAALLEADIDPAWPLVFQDGTYVVPHEGGVAAVGSTSETTFASGTETDGQLDDVVAKAAALCPALAGAPVIERWAGIRPKAVKRDPMIGPVPGYGGLFVATGGFKITFGIAHEMARCVLDFALEGRGEGIPQSFRIEHHLAG